MKAYESNGALLFHRQVTPLDIITTRAILEVVGAIMAGALVVLATIGTGYMEPPKDYGLLYLGLLYQAVFSYSAGLIISALSEYSDIVERSISVILYLSLPLSGAFTMVDWLPATAQSIVEWSPSVQNIEMIRGGQFGPGVHPIYDLVYNTKVTIILLLVGFFLTRGIRRHLVVQ